MHMWIIIINFMKFIAVLDWCHLHCKYLHSWNSVYFSCVLCKQTRCYLQRPSGPRNIDFSMVTFEGFCFELDSTSTFIQAGGQEHQGHWWSRPLQAAFLVWPEDWPLDLQFQDGRCAPRLQSPRFYEYRLSAACWVWQTWYWKFQNRGC